MASRLDLPVSVDENAPLNNANNLGLYPNPFSEQLNIQFSTLPDSDARVTIYNSSGIMVRSFNAGNNKHLAWDRNDDKGNPVPPGIYLLEITSGNVRSTGKVIVTN
ncbi:MAG: T9SS type A sorting domain-containing protein [Bacteroidetes bacterium]|nr:T9SS type A sorting domain-containing protein [Bacteroidota bacterium]